MAKRLDDMIDRQIRKFDPAVKKGDEDHWCYRILFSAAMITSNPEKLKRFWRCKKASKLIDTAVEKKIIVDDKLDYDIFGPEHLGAGLALGAALMRGFVNRHESSAA